MRRAFQLATIGFLAASSVPAAAVTFGTSLNINGTVGLIDMPSALTFPDGQTSWSFTGSDTMSGTVLSFQLLPNVEAVIRMQNLQDWNGPGDNQAERSLDLKFVLFEEQGWRPALALGFTDFGANGPLASEYIVATKSLGETFRITAGLGWGRLGTYNPIGAPFGTRAPQTSNTPGIDHFFAGDMAFFGGFEWDTPVNGLTFKAEYSSDAYVGEQLAGFTVNSPFNFGLDYQISRNLNLGAYYMRGNAFGFRVTLTGNPNSPVTPPDFGTGPLPVRARTADSNMTTAWASNAPVRGQMANLLATSLGEIGISIIEARLRGDTIDLQIQNNRYVREPKAIGRLARALTVALPPSVENFRISLVNGGLATTTVVLRRSDIEAQVERPNAGPESYATTQFVDAPNRIEDADFVREIDPRFSWSLTPQIDVNLFGGDAFTQADIILRGNASYRINRGLSFNLAVSQRLIGNIGEGAGPSTSPLPHVRSDAALYDSSGPVLTRLTADYLFKLNPSTYGRVSAGYLERYFAGVSAEVLWHPTAQNWGLGVELNYVRQRAFDNMFDLQDYETLSGFVSLYWDTGWNGFEAQVDVGRYLAGDWGATFSLSRRFTNGWELSGYITLTDVSFDDFGNGNFDKGIALTIPLDWTLPYESRSRTTIGLGGYGSDGGARANISNRLYPIIRDYNQQDLYDSWGAYWQ